jgi:hypothetical protein
MKPHQDQIALPPMEVRKADRDPAVVRKTDQARESAESLAATIFDAALKSAGIERGEAAYLFGVSTSMVDKMCSPNERQAPSLIQLLMMPPHFHIALIKELDKHFGLGRALLARVQESLGTLGLLVR